MHAQPNAGSYRKYSSVETATITKKLARLVWMQVHWINSSKRSSSSNNRWDNNNWRLCSCNSSTNNTMALESTDISTSSWVSTTKANLLVKSSQRCSRSRLKTHRLLRLCRLRRWHDGASFNAAQPFSLDWSFALDGHTVSSFTRWWPQWQPQRNNEQQLGVNHDSSDALKQVTNNV